MESFSVVVDKSIEVARVTGLPIAPFASMRDGSIDANSINRLAGFGRRCAYNHGWVDGLNPTFRVNTRVGVVPSATNGDSEDCEHAGHGKTVFLVAQLVVIDLPRAYVPQSYDECCAVQCELTACGTSSYTVSTEVFDSSNAVRKGYAVQTFVNIDAATRKPTAIDGVARQRAAAALVARADDGAAVSLRQRVGATRGIQRLDPRELKPESGAEAGGDFTLAFESRVRPFSDFDFNGHVNQGVYVTVALDAVYAFVKSPPAAPVPEAFQRLQAQKDLHVQSVRVDYLKEVADAAAVLKARLWRVKGSAETDQAAMSLWFEITVVGTDTVNAQGVIVLMLAK